MENRFGSVFAALRRDEQWEVAAVDEIEWVRLVRDRGCVFGVGFRKAHLVYFVGTDSDPDGLICRVSLPESTFLLRNLAGLEMSDRPDVDSNATAWRRWRGLLGFS